MQRQCIWLADSARGYYQELSVLAIRDAFLVMHDQKEEAAHGKP